MYVVDFISDSKPKVGTQPKCAINLHLICIKKSANRALNLGIF